MWLGRREINERYVDMSHGKTRYLEAGSGPPLILLHMFGLTKGAHCWLLNIEELAERFHVLAPDYVGWGFGDRLNQAYSFGYLVDFVREFQDVLGFERTHVVGHAVGGWIAMLLAYESPQRVDKLVLAGSGGLSQPIRAEHAKTPTPEDIRARLEKTMNVSPEDLDRLTDEEVRITQLPGALDAYQRVLEHFADTENRDRYEVSRRFPHIAVPTLIVWGGRDEVTNMDMARTLQTGIPESRLTVIEDGGHYLPTTHAPEFNRIVAEFLAG
ncbi:MAG: 2-hydroxy-6-oxo-octa-2,4-dienoate hydrolase [Chloroflexi bacterium]|jgi:pimeloyl-ACP methyl ester carboxylesterase|nr:MAG: 2-hydroxy-6-oxo-octa-2,4-dienoate hydrolase [Chloroflexota bacterium]